MNPLNAWYMPKMTPYRCRKTKDRQEDPIICTWNLNDKGTQLFTATCGLRCPQYTNWVYTTAGSNIDKLILESYKTHCQHVVTVTDLMTIIIHTSGIAICQYTWMTFTKCGNMCVWYKMRYHVCMVWLTPRGICSRKKQDYSLELTFYIILSWCIPTIRHEMRVLAFHKNSKH